VDGVCEVAGIGEGLDAVRGVYELTRLAKGALSPAKDGSRTTAQSTGTPPACWLFCGWFKGITRGGGGE
jgi:hypothetical protein